MLGTIIVILALLWGLGFLNIPSLPFQNMVLFRLFGHSITLWELLMFVVILWAMESLPSPLRQIAFVLILLWVLSILGIIAITGLSNLIIGALIIGIVLAIFQNR
jgi:hypothetical protein